jgi:hypothetical protein
MLKKAQVVPLQTTDLKSVAPVISDLVVREVFAKR